ncbi:unnamed protein product [Clonostachys rhizophaga]|uniref:Nephrocystin 3-like N-terminal domain-containing protein n=1 Tax=Clonostachys rhizophaga TaxID=160324 RepID=A0A9N9VCF4_9HYPO|nr:unnamed protein product [Clonostachys rhizophaga]
MSGLEGLGLAANIIAVIDLSAKVISWCSQYSKDVKNARNDIEQPQQETHRLYFMAEEFASSLKVRTWPHESKDVEGLLQELVRTSEIFHLGLQIDQTNIIIGSDERARLDRIPVAEGASSHADDEDATTCLPDTRVQLQQDIWKWVNSDTAELIMWPSADAKDRSNLSKFISTLAADLAVKIPETCRHVLDTIEDQSDIFKKVVGDQLDQPIIEPIIQCQAIRVRRPIVIAIDALDECKREADMMSFIQLLTRSQTAQVSCLRILLTSRPELPIRLGFSLADSESFQSVTLHDTPDEVIRKDILTSLLFHLSKIREEYNASDISYDRKLGPAWPGKK